MPRSCSITAQSIVSCTVKNLSSIGACLSVASTYRLPDTFELTFEHGRSRRSCRVIWRTDDKLGVAFDAGRAAQAPDAFLPEGSRHR